VHAEGVRDRAAERVSETEDKVVGDPVTELEDVSVLESIVDGVDK